MREEEKIKAGILFCPADPELKAIKLKTHNLNLEYNGTCEDETEKRGKILSEILGKFRKEPRRSVYREMLIWTRARLS